MDTYVLALQLYLFNKACGGLPLKIAEQIVVNGIINATYWTARAVGSGVMWFVRPSPESITTATTHNTNSVTTDYNFISTPNISSEIGKDFEPEFEIITSEQILEIEQT